jgi:Tfp pilus assembly protein PilX
MSRAHLSPRLRAEDGFTMIIAIGVMFVTSLLLVAAFAIANDNIATSHNSTAQKQAYYAALGGIQQYEYQLQSNPNYWQTCGKLESKVPGETNERYVVTPVVAESAPAKSTCSSENPFTTMIQSTGQFANTFRVKSVGEVTVNAKHKATRTLIATFGVTGFLQYVFYTNYETVDPGLYESEEPTLAKNCRGKSYAQWKGKYSCPTIEFGSGDEIEGPLHTNDAGDVTGSAVFGRASHEPKDVIEFDGGTYGSSSGCKSTAKYNTASGCYITNGPTLTPPPNNESLAGYVEPSYEFEGATHLELKGSEIFVTYHNSSGAELTETVKWPPNGLIYVQGNSEHACKYTFEVENSDTALEKVNEVYCGNVYVSGYYEKSLTIGGSQDVIVNGSVYPTSVKAKLGSKPTGTAVLGLISGTGYVRVYHPCTSNKNGTESFSSPWIYAGILATAHSWIVDNSGCGAALGNLNVFGAIGQNYRGIVLQSNGKETHGYVKNYEYDDRLATDEPPYFLAPLKAGWKIVRQTAPAFG